MEDHNSRMDHFLLEDQQDAWEAYSTFRTARTLFFALLLIGLLIAGSCFWVVNQGLVDQALELTGQNATLIPLGFSGESGESQKNNQQTELVNSLNDLVRISLSIWNLVMAFCALLFCLTLLIGLKLALVGRLGGLAEAGKAFFLSLMVMVLIVPWQSIITPQSPGALFRYDYLIDRYLEMRSQPEAGLIPKLGYYGRFIGLWGLSIILLLMSLRRSRQASGKIKARLEAQQKPESIKELEVIPPGPPPA